MNTKRPTASNFSERVAVSLTIRSEKSTHSLPVRECLSAKYRMKTAVTPQVQSLSLHQSQTSSKPTIIKAILNTTLSQKAIKMKRTKYAILTAIVLSISTALAQPKANIKVSYDWHQYSPKGVQYKTRMMLCPDKKCQNSLNLSGNM